MTDPVEDKIRARAFAIWELEGCPEGRHIEHWLRAEAEIGAEAVKPARKPAAAKAAKTAKTPSKPAAGTRAKSAAAPRRKAAKA